MADGSSDRGGGREGARETPLPATAAVLARWRQQAGLSRQRLADLADVSATYVRTIEAGVDDLGREVVPSAAVMRKLARGLAQALSPETGATDEALAQQIQAEFLAAAGYLPGAPEASSSQAGMSLAAASEPAAAPAAPPVSREVAGQESVSARPSPDELHRRLGEYARVQQTHARAEAVRSAASAIAAAMWRDQRLWQDARPLLEHWERLDRDDQALLLGIMAWIHERQQRRQEWKPGGV